MSVFPSDSSDTAIAPSLKALSIQIVAVLAAAALLISLKKITGTASPAIVFAVLTGTMAAVISYRCHLAWWWMPIQLLFTPALLAANTLPIPPVAFLIIFLVLLGVFWNTFRTQVPLFLSGPAVWDAVEVLLPTRPVRCIDIGSGLGGVVLALAACRRDCEFVGVELAPLPWLISAIRGRMRRSSARFIRRDYYTLDLADYDVVFAYLSPAAMPAVWQQARAQMRSGSMLISYAFGLAEVPPDQVSQPNAVGPSLFVWFPAAHRQSP